MKKIFLLPLILGILILGFGIISMASVDSIVQDRYLISWICNLMIAFGVMLLYLAYVFFRHGRRDELSEARRDAEEAVKAAKDAKIQELELELSEALKEIKKLKQQ